MNEQPFPRVLREEERFGVSFPAGTEFTNARTLQIRCSDRSTGVRATHLVSASHFKVFYYLG